MAACIVSYLGMPGNVASLPHNVFSMFVCSENDYLNHAICLIAIVSGCKRKDNRLAESVKKYSSSAFPNPCRPPVVAARPTRTIELL